MNPLVIGIAAVLLPKIADLLQEKATKASAPARRRAPFTQWQVNRFTHLAPDNARHFDADIGEKLARLCSTRAALLEPPSPRAPDAQIWKVVPIGTPKATGAAHVITQARAEGRDVYASLTLFLLPLGRPTDRMLLVTAPKGYAPYLAGQTSQLALLDPPVAPATEVEAEPETPPEHLNGHATTTAASTEV